MIAELKPLPEIYIKPEPAHLLYYKIATKLPAIKSLVVAVGDLFTNGAISKIDNAVEQIISNNYSNTDDSLAINIIQGDSQMNPLFDTIKNYLVGYLVKLAMTAGGTLFVAAGIKTDDIAQIVAGGVTVIIAIIYQLLTHQNVANTNPAAFKK